MPKIKNNTKYILASVFVLIIIIGGVYGSGFMQQFYTGGFEVLSITASQPISNDADIASTKFLITATIPRTGSDSVIGYISQANFLSETTKTGLGYGTDYPLQIRAIAQDEVLNLRVQNDNIPIYKYEPTIIDCFAGIFCGVTDCPDGTDIAAIKPAPNVWSLPKIYCYNKNKVATKGRIIKTNIIDEMEIIAKVGTEKATVILNSQQSSNFASGTLRTESGKYVGEVEVVGNLWTGDFPPATEDYVAIYPTGGTKWRISTDDKWDNYIINYNIIKNKESSNWQDNLFSYNEIKNIINSVNSASSILKESNDNLLDTSGNILQVDSSQANDLNNGQFRITLDRKLGIPMIKMWIKADWVGVAISVGKPKIISTDCISLDNKDIIKSGSGGKVKFKVKNIGTSKGQFASTIEGCDFIPRYTGFSNEFGLEAGEFKDVEMLIDYNEVKEVSQTCKFTVYDKSKAENKDSVSIVCKGDKPTSCEENKTYQFGNDLKICKNGEMEYYCTSTSGFEYNSITQRLECITSEGGECGKEGDKIGLGQPFEFCCEGYIPEGGFLGDRKSVV